MDTIRRLRRRSLDERAVVISCRIAHSISQIHHTSLNMRGGRALALVSVSDSVLPRPPESVSMFPTTIGAFVTTEVARRVDLFERTRKHYRSERTEHPEASKHNESSQPIARAEPTIDGPKDNRRRCRNRYAN